MGAEPHPPHIDLEGAFSSYLDKTYGFHSGYSDCRTGTSRNVIVALKKEEDAEAVSYKLKIVETNWAAAGSASAASSLATPPAASANAQTLPPPAAQPVIDTSKAQVNGQIKQAAQNALSKLFHQ